MTVGATEAIAAAVLGLVEPGSEVVLIQPFYDSYSPVVAMAGGQRVIVPLVPDGRGFALDIDALRRAVTPRTRALMLNSPHNPTGTVLSEAELAAIAEIAVAADLLVITDEVYEHLVFDGHRHIPLAGLRRDGRAHGHDLECGEDVQLHRLEDRMGLRAGGSASASSSALACSDWQPPSTAARDWSATRARLFSGCCAVSAEPAVCA